MYIWNNMFFSLGFDVKDHYKDFGGDAAAHAAPTNDLQGVRAINTLDLDGLHTLGTVVVDYRGMRVTAQSIVPGKLAFLSLSLYIDNISEKKRKKIK
jgi:protein TIF31